MRKYLRLIFKGLGILSLVIAVGIFVTIFFLGVGESLGKSPTAEERLDLCESHYCISIGPKGSEKFEDCVSDCMEKTGLISRVAVPFTLALLVPGSIIFFIVLGVILLIISYVISLPWDDNGSNKEDEI